MTKQATLLFSFFILFQTVYCQSFGHKENGVNLMSRSGKTAFVPENSKLRIHLINGRELTGHLTGADSSSIHITPSYGKQIIVLNSDIKKITVFHDHEYFTLLDGALDGMDGCGGNNCDAAGVIIVVGVVVAITAAELLFDGVADLANDDHYDLVNNWKVSGPVRGEQY